MPRNKPEMAYPAIVTDSQSLSVNAIETTGPTDLLGMSRDELTAVLREIGVDESHLGMRTSQVWNWIYHRGVTEFSAMANISKSLQKQLEANFIISRPDVTSYQISEDGTRKYLVRFRDGNEAESVFIPDEDRGTLCISSQVGCTLNCRFCYTGTQRLVRNLSANEIVSQIMIARDDLGEWPTPTDGRKITNIVLMGMGEPLYNFENVKKAVLILRDPEGIQMSRRRITLSTAGVVPLMERAGREIGVNLAVSLHAVTDEVRDKLVPINRKYPIHELLSACRDYPGAHNARRITFEYIMLKDINDSDADAKKLVGLIHKYELPAKVNLIPFNPWPGAPYECSDWERIEKFSSLIFKSGVSAPIRMPRGRDIMAACGQLKSASIKIKASERKKL